MIASRSCSSVGTTTHRPEWVIPMATTSYRSRSIAANTLPAVRQEMACSLLVPPNTTATRGRRVGTLSVIALTLPAA